MRMFCRPKEEQRRKYKFNFKTVMKLCLTLRVNSMEQLDYNYLYLPVSTDCVNTGRSVSVSLHTTRQFCEKVSYLEYLCQGLFVYLRILPGVKIHQ